MTRAKPVDGGPKKGAPCGALARWRIYQPPSTKGKKTADAHCPLQLLRFIITSKMAVNFIFVSGHGYRFWGGSNSNHGSHIFGGCRGGSGRWQPGKRATCQGTIRGLKACPYACRVCAMPQPNWDKSKLPPYFEPHHCPSCGFPMGLLRTEPTEDVDCEARVFQCSTCVFEETVKVRFRRGVGPNI
jgi:hypothetical protein